ncbi:MAG: glycosyltransferase family 2 protein [Gammaproteobacteria bacterium]
MLSVIIIAKNEASKIRDCLESVKWADEIIVLDSGSSDETVTICKQYTDKVFVTDWPGFGPQKQRALAKASHEWTLSIDADERVPAQLKTEIQSALRQPQYDGYDIPRSTFFCGQKLRFSGSTPDYVLRLVRTAKACVSDDLIHEKISVSGSTGKLTHTLTHYSFDDLQSVIVKINSYSELGAQQLKAKGKTASLSSALTKGLWTFIRTYFFRAGFLDGRRGLLLAISNAQGTYYKYAKLAMMR